METKTPANFWWLKSPSHISQDTENNLIVPKLDLHSASSVNDLLEKEPNSYSDVDVGSIIEEINRVAAQSPLGPYDNNLGDRSVEDLMREAERIYMESSKSFEQLSQKSRTSQNLTDLLSNLSKDSTPTPKSLSPLPMDPDPQESSETEDYSEDFSEESKVGSAPVAENVQVKYSAQNNSNGNLSENTSSDDQVKSTKENKSINNVFRSNSISKSIISIKDKYVPSPPHHSLSQNIIENEISVNNAIPTDRMADKDELQEMNEIIEIKNNLIKTLEEDNKFLKQDIQNIKFELQKTNSLLEQTKAQLNAKAISSPEINLEWEKALEALKDSREVNTALQLQLDSVNKTHQLFKSSYDELVSSNKNLERRVVELDSSLDKYKNEFLTLQKTKDKLLESELNLNKLLEIEKLQAKSLKLQNEKDARCIQDLNRQIKEMERIIARKHPDSVSALIVAAKENSVDTNMTARKILEDRIKLLEQEQVNRDCQSSKLFLEIQEKFNQMKSKYENHIDDLELHVNDLKNQLKRKSDTYDVYTQTIFDEKIPQKETFTVFTQTDKAPVKFQKPITIKKLAIESLKEDSHLIATIKGLQTDLSNKEKVVSKLQREVDDLRKTNRRLQKEREGSLKSLSDKKEFRSFPEKLALQVRSNSSSSDKDFRKEEELQQLKCERDKLKQQLRQLEEEYQILKTKRIQDLTALQEAHEREVANYVTSISPLKEQLEIQQVSITTLQEQLASAKEELAVAVVERDHLNKRLLEIPCISPNYSGGGDGGMEYFIKKIAYMEKQYEDREFRLRAIVQSMAQKTVTNRSCEQCAERQKQLIAYKVELDQLLATVRALY